MAERTPPPPEPESTLTSPDLDGEGVLGRIGPYVLEEEIGRGGMGVIYRARDSRLRRVVAVKGVPEAVALRPALLKRFEREARLLAALNHPNIATIHAIEEKDGRPYLILEHVPGDPLSQKLSLGPLPVREALVICLGVARALQAAHRAGVVHRDLKPSNVLVTPEGSVKVLDFGLAASVTAPNESDGDADLSREGSVFGTPGYMSPEQASGEPLERTTDIWSFGCLMFECLAGRRLFGQRTARERVRALLDEEPDLEGLPADLPEEVRWLLTRCLTKEPSRRLADIGEAVNVLARATDEPINSGSGSLVRARRARGNLPRELTSLLGRDKDLEELARLAEASRLITLTGVGGCGKTRLALRLAADLVPRFAHGAWLIELGPLADPALVPQAVGSALGLREERGQPLVETLAAWLEERSVLLVLDNCEHLLGATAALVERLLQAAPDLHIVATSREALGASGETIRGVKSLGDDVAVQLFEERARAVRSDFAVTTANQKTVTEVCRRLDGIPLAIELAASRLRTMTLEQIARRLDDRFRLLTGGSRTALERHQTLRATMDWSHEHLSEPEKVLLRRLSVFAGGLTLEAAEGVCSGDGIEREDVLDLLGHLVDKSLVLAEAQGEEGSYRLLETVRQYGRQRLLDEEEGVTVSERHLGWFLALAEQADARLQGPEQVRWLAVLEREHDNLRAALGWCGASEEGAAKGLRLVAALGRFWGVHGHFGEGRGHCREALVREGASRPTPERARALLGAALLAHYQGDFGAARTLATEALGIGREVGDRWAVARALNGLGSVSHAVGDYVGARRLHQDGLTIARELGNPELVGLSLTSLGWVARSTGDHAAARSLNLEGLGFARELGDRRSIAGALNNLGLLATDTGDYADARRLFEESLTLRRELGDPAGIAGSLNNLGDVSIHTREYAAARALHQQSLAIKRELGDRHGIASSLINLGAVALETGNLAGARAHNLEGLRLSQEIGLLAMTAYALGGIACVDAQEGSSARAARLLGAAEALRERIGLNAEAVERAQYERARSLLGDALDAAELATLLAEGRSLPAERAVELALAGVAPA